MTTRVLVLGAGFGGLELTTMMSEAFGEDADVTLIDKGDSFVFGYSKLDVMFGRTTPDAVRLPYREFVKPGVRVLRETVTAIDPAARRVTTDRGTHEADALVVALGADYDFDATRRDADARPASRVLARPGHRRCVRRAVQVPVGAQRGGPAAARPPHRAGRARRLRDQPRAHRHTRADLQGFPIGAR